MDRKININVQKQLSEFYSRLDYKPLSANAISIYLILLEIACKIDWLREFKVTNTTLMSKIKRLSISSLQRARNELITNEYIVYKKGTNQNDASSYTIIRLYSDEFKKSEQADEQASEQASEQAGEMTNDYIITKLNILFNYIYNNAEGEEIGLKEKDRYPIILILKRLDLYSEDQRAYFYMSDRQVLDQKIMIWAIKELYISPYKVYLNNLQRNKFVLKYLKTKKYIKKKPGHTLQDIIKYFIACLQEELDRDKWRYEKKIKEEESFYEQVRQINRQG